MTKTDIFIEKSKIIHLDKYDYNNINYIDNSTKVEIKIIIVNEKNDK